MLRLCGWIKNAWESPAKLAGWFGLLGAFALVTGGGNAYVAGVDQKGPACGYC
jgi:hypothetical protein